MISSQAVDTHVRIFFTELILKMETAISFSYTGRQYLPSDPDVQDLVINCSFTQLVSKWVGNHIF